MSSSSKDEAEIAAGDASELPAQRNAERMKSFVRSGSPLFINTAYIMGVGDEIRLVVGQRIDDEFLPSGHMVLTLGAFQQLLEAGGEHLKKVAAGRMGPCAGSA